MLTALALAHLTLAAPAPKQGPRPTVEAVRAALGKSHLGKEVRSIGRALGQDPVIRYTGWYQDWPEADDEIFFELLWKEKGLVLNFDKGLLRSAWLYNDKVKGFGKYVGELPEGLTFADDRTDVEKRLGQAETVLRFPLEDDPKKKVPVRFDLFYKKKGVCVTLLRAIDGASKIHAIAIFPPGDAPTWWEDPDPKP